MKESVGATKKFPKRKFFVRAFGSDISCNEHLYKMILSWEHGRSPQRLILSGNAETGTPTKEIS
jgi:hypothetical protein